MVSAFPMQSYYQSSSLTADTTQAQKPLFTDDDNNVLDDNVLDQSALDSGLDLSPPMADSRRESFAVGPPLFSPKTEDWQSVEMQSLPSNSHLMDQPSNNPFMRMDQNQHAAFGLQNPWSVHHAQTTSAETSLHHFDGLSGDCDGNVSVFHNSMHGPSPFANTGNIFAGLGSGSQSIPTSPQKEWAAQQAANKKMRPGSPSFRSYNDLRRGDGIRKKNARFEIPPERTLNNIDQLISQSTDEQEIKELKQQKRLLRNRQAALDSRQRKKLHTERLEDEKKHFTAIISDMEDDINALKAQLEQVYLEKNKCMECIETLTMEKDEMIRSHTIESGDLRKKVGVLTDHVQRLELNSMSTGIARPDSTAGTFDHMDGLTMMPGWDTPNFLNDYTVEPEAEPEMKQEMTIVPAKKRENNFSTSDGEKGATQGGLLFMLFLVGAFVMSNRSPQPLPPVSEDFREASAALLDNVLKDVGVKPPNAGMQTVAGQMSSTGWNAPVPSMPANDMHMDSVSPSMLSELGNSLTQPTQQQSNEQIFSLSAAQYNGVSDTEFMNNAHHSDRPTGQGRKNLAEAIAAMRNTDKQTGAADVYTRSLLWDQIPSEVVRNFAKMFAECNNAQNEQQCNEAR